MLCEITMKHTLLLGTYILPMEIQANVLKNGQLQYVNSSTKSIIFSPDWQEHSPHIYMYIN